MEASIDPGIFSSIDPGGSKGGYSAATFTQGLGTKRHPSILAQWHSLTLSAPCDVLDPPPGVWPCLGPLAPDMMKAVMFHNTTHPLRTIHRNWQSDNLSTEKSDHLILSWQSIDNQLCSNENLIIWAQKNPMRTSCSTRAGTSQHIALRAWWDMQFFNIAGLNYQVYVNKKQIKQRASPNGTNAVKIQASLYWSHGSKPKCWHQKGHDSSSKTQLTWCFTQVFTVQMLSSVRHSEVDKLNFLWISLNR
jgi:hypothetical protein